LLCQRQWLVASLADILAQQSTRSPKSHAQFGVGTCSDLSVNGLRLCPRSLRSAYRLTVRQYDAATQGYIVTAEAYHIMFKPLNTQFNWVNLQNLVRYDVQSYIVIEPYTYVLEKGGKMRMFYGNIPLNMPKTREFAIKQWRSIVEVRAKAEQERVAKKKPDYVPNALQGDNPLVAGMSRDDHMDAIMRLEQEKSAMFYDRVKKVEPPPRPLRETGQLPSIDHLFEIDDF